MAKNITLYPTLTKFRSKDIFKVSLPLLKYNKDGRVYDLKLNEPESSISSISDDNGFWNANEYDLIFEWKISYENTAWLYDSDMWDYACACHNAKVGIALAWYSSDSRRRSTIPIKVIENDIDSHFVTCKQSFKAGELKGEVGFSLILYLQESGNPIDDEFKFANVPGTILGEISSLTLCLDGNGSTFTIYEEDKPGAPLWDVEYNIDDPASDLFSECVSICLNRAHKKFPLVKRGSEMFCQQLLNEIMANSMAVVIEMVRAYEKSDNFDCLSDFDEGSVAQALAYFKDKLLWDFSSPITVSHSARLFVENNIKDYENIRI
jgi:hypothetical protein